MSSEDFPISIPVSQETVSRCSVVAFSKKHIGIEQAIDLIDNNDIRKELVAILNQYGDMPLNHLLQRSSVVMKRAGYFPN
jgi:uncharacterized protein YjfI (DUF2170 family)